MKEKKLGFWAIVLACVGVALIATGLFVTPAQQSTLPDATMTEAPSVEPSVPVPSSTPTEQVSFGTCEVDGMYIPDLPLKKGERNKWDIISLTPKQDREGDIPLPPHESSLKDPNPPPSLVSGYTIKYHTAGPQADDMVAIIGHSSPWRVLPFNSLMNQGKEGKQAPRVKAGQHIYLHTTCSGKWWLDGVVDDTFTAGKPEFTSDPRIFGTTKMPGWIAVITCLQPKVGSSHEVVAIVGHLVDVVRFPG